MSDLKKDAVAGSYSVQRLPRGMYLVKGNIVSDPEGKIFDEGKDAEANKKLVKKFVQEETSKKLDTLA